MLYKILTIVKFLNPEFTIVKMKLPCEIAIWYILPVVRSELSKELGRLGMAQRRIALFLGISEAAVSQYIKGKRGRGMKMGIMARSAVKHLADDILHGNLTKEQVAKRLCDVCVVAKKEETACKVHKEKFGAPPECQLCLR
jgi:predicted transcriptional regulator